jgi:nucleotide-binding universal stress UspA family protein
MFERILLAVDGSPRSERTIPVAVDLGQRYGAEVTVVHVREYDRYEGDDVDLGPPIPADQLVDGVVGTFHEAGLKATGTVRRVSPGRTAEMIVDVAEQNDAELIVMGTRGMTELKSLLLGGVATKVVNRATCPVLLVR